METFRYHHKLEMATDWWLDPDCLGDRGYCESLWSLAVSQKEYKGKTTWGILSKNKLEASVMNLSVIDDQRDQKCYRNKTQQIFKMQREKHWRDLRFPFVPWPIRWPSKKEEKRKRSRIFILYANGSSLSAEQFPSEIIPAYWYRQIGLQRERERDEYLYSFHLFICSILQKLSIEANDCCSGRRRFDDVGLLSRWFYIKYSCRIVATLNALNSWPEVETNHHYSVFRK